MSHLKNNKPTWSERSNSQQVIYTVTVCAYQFVCISPCTFVYMSLKIICTLKNVVLFYFYRSRLTFIIFYIFLKIYLWIKYSKYKIYKYFIESCVILLIKVYKYSLWRGHSHYIEYKFIKVLDSIKFLSKPFFIFYLLRVCNNHHKRDFKNLREK